MLFVITNKAREDGEATCLMCLKEEKNPCQASILYAGKILLKKWSQNIILFRPKKQKNTRNKTEIIHHHKLSLKDILKEDFRLKVKWY